MGERIEKLLNQFKANKKPALFISVGAILIVALIISELCSFSKEEDPVENDNAFYENYTLKIEKKLEEIVSSIQGAGECKIMITLDTGEESIYAKQSKNLNEDRNESSKSSDEYEYVILKSSSTKEEGMLLKVVEPNVRGVAIVCQGGDDPLIKSNIINAVSAVLNIKTNKISITKMK